MMRALIYYLHNPSPPRSGAHRRFLWMSRKLMDAGWEIHLASSDLHSETQWTDESIANLQAMGYASISLYRKGRPEKILDKIKRRIPALNHEDSRPDHDWVRISLYHKRWFQRVIRKVEPDCLIINYAWFAKLLSEKTFSKYRTVIETHDLLQINHDLRLHVQSLLSGFNPDSYDSCLFDVCSMNRLHFSECEEEISDYRKFDRVLAISEKEFELLSKHIDKHKILYIPVQEEPMELANTYNDKILITASPNPFNRLGILMFLTKVWPLVRRETPDAELIITGMPQDKLFPHSSGVTYAGYVDDLDALYQKAPFSVSPVYYGTGQQVKVVESLARAVPVIAFDLNTVSPLLVNNHNGYRASSINDMASGISKLWKDRNLCRIMGNNAIEATKLKAHTNPLIQL